VEVTEQIKENLIEMDELVLYLSAGLITGYYVEKREQNTDEWVPVNILPYQSTHYTVPSLLEDHVYEFRVIAENEAGRGAPSEPSNPTKVNNLVVIFIYMNILFFI